MRRPAGRPGPHTRRRSGCGTSSPSFDRRATASGRARTVARKSSGTVRPATRAASSAFVIATADRLTAQIVQVLRSSSPAPRSYPQDPVENPARVSGKVARDGEYLAEFVPRSSLGRCASRLLYADTPRDALASDQRGARAQRREPFRRCMTDAPAREVPRAHALRGPRLRDRRSSSWAAVSAELAADDPPARPSGRPPRSRGVPLPGPRGDEEHHRIA